jgi:acyl transferase domain-containing protein
MMGNGDGMNPPPVPDSAIEPLAIVGLSARFPGARDADEYWRNLRAGVESVSSFDARELVQAGIPPAVVEHPRYIRARGALGDVDLFDAAFFGYTPNEAQAMDPQQRLFLECAHAALEHAGYAGDSQIGSVGVYAGCGLNSYLLNNLSAHPEMLQYVGFDKDYLATRVSYKLNLKGPSIAVQTACSTSLVAICQAAQALLTYQCDLALAGGVAIVLPDRSGYFYADGAIFSPDGHCRAFDAAAQGIVPGNGVGVVALKRLNDAIADGDVIHAVVRGFALNNDGAAKVGYTAPSIDGQAQAILMAHELAGVSADTISYVEAHGTGTPLGDPVEIAALTHAFRTTSTRNGYCAIGSVKSNIGHLDAAAGVASLIKTVLALRHRELPPSLHFAQPNPKIDFENSPFYVNARLAEWPAGSGPRRAGVSSFGIGGTNAHVVLEEAPEREPSGPSRPWSVLTVSGQTAAALDTATARLSGHLAATADPLADIAFSLQTGRARFAHRRAVVCRDPHEAVAALQARDPRLVHESVGDEGERAVVFMFPGQGSQYPGMGAGLYAQEEVFRRAVDDCAALALRDIDFDLRAIISPADEQQRVAAAERLEDTRVTQPAIFTLEYALACLWMSWGVKPAAMIGHSLGEYVAACVAGVFDLADAMRIVCMRAAAMSATRPGAMLAVSLSEADVRRRLGADLWLAAANAPAWSVVAGERARVEAFERELAGEGIAVQRLHTAGAFHSALMRDVAGPLADAIGDMPLGRPQIPYISNLTGTWIRDDEVRDPAYWARQVTEPVRFREGIEELAGFGAHVFLEIGPGQTLGRLAEQCLAGTSARPLPLVAASLPAARDRAGDAEVMAGAIATLWVAGATIDWRAYYAAERRLRVELPTYPFERQRYWLTPAPVRSAPAAAPPRAELADWFALPSWKRTPAPRPAEPGDSYLIFADEAGVGPALAARLRESGRTVALVRAGSVAIADGADLTIDPLDPSHYDWLALELRNRGPFPSSVLYLWGVTGAVADLTREQCETSCFFALLNLTRLIGSDDESAGRRLFVVTDGVHDITGHERLNPFKALALGPCRVAPQEYPSLVCRHIDVVIGADPADLVGRLAAEIDSAATERSVALRGIDRWVPASERIRLEGVEAGGEPLLPEQGVYLITGGFGGIGLEIARHLARTLKPTLVLTSRDALPHRSRWPERLARRADPRTVQRIHAVQALEALGAQVVAMQADVCDEGAMRALVADVERGHGPIDGVVHAAGVAGGGVIHLKTAEVAARVLAPKVTGVDVLSRVFDRTPPRFIALCSSLTSLAGGFGQVDYCAANACLDAFARAQTARKGILTIAINWDSWRDVGMSVDTHLPRDLEARRAAALATGIAPAEGVDAFVRALHARQPQILVSPDVVKFTAPRQAAPVAAEPAPAPVQAPAAAAPRRPRPLSTPLAAPADAIEEAVCRLWQDMLGIDVIGVHDSFFDLGGHSVLAIQVVARLNQQFGTHVPVARLYEGMTPAFLAEAIRAAAGEAAAVAVEAAPVERGRDRALQQKQHQQRRQAARQGERSVVMESAEPLGAGVSKTGERQ